MGSRYFHDPVSIITGGAALLGAAGSFLGGESRARGAENDAAFFAAQIETETIAFERNTQDLESERRRTLSRTRAAMTANGADTSGGSALSVLKAQDEQFKEGKRRIELDFETMIRNLNNRVIAERSRADDERLSGIFGGVTGLASGAVSIIRATA